MSNGRPVLLETVTEWPPTRSHRDPGLRRSVGGSRGGPECPAGSTARPCATQSFRSKRCQEWLKTRPPHHTPGYGCDRAARFGGGGGHRTHVRKPSATGIYINSRLSSALASRPSNRLDYRVASPRRSRSAPGGRAWSQSPEYDARSRTLMTRSGGHWRVLSRQG